MNAVIRYRIYNVPESVSLAPDLEKEVNGWFQSDNYRHYLVESSWNFDVG